MPHSLPGLCRVGPTHYPWGRRPILFKLRYWIHCAGVGEIRSMVTFSYCQTPQHMHMDGKLRTRQVQSTHFFWIIMTSASAIPLFVFFFNTIKNSFFGRFSVVYITYNIQSYDSYDYEVLKFQNIFSPSLPNAKWCPSAELRGLIKNRPAWYNADAREDEINTHMSICLSELW